MPRFTEKELALYESISGRRLELRVELGAFGARDIAVEVFAVQGEHPGIPEKTRVVASWTCTDVRDARRLAEVRPKLTRDFFDRPTAELLPHMVRATLIELLTHELDEWLRVDGAQVHDPSAAHSGL